MRLGLLLTPTTHSYNSRNTHAIIQRYDQSRSSQFYKSPRSIRRKRKNKVSDGFRKSNIASRQLSQVTNPGAGAQYLTSHSPKEFISSFHHQQNNAKRMRPVPNTTGHPYSLTLVSGVAFACSNGVTSPAQTNRNSFHHCAIYPRAP